MSETREERAERIYARQEQSLARVNEQRVQRGPVSIVVVLLGVSLIVGITAAVDLRRLATPRGAALAWTGAAVFGDCTAYRRLSVADPGARVADTRSEEQVCAALQAATSDARDRPTQYAVDAGDAVVRGGSAAVPVTVVTPDRERAVTVELVRTGDEWRVVRTRTVCRAVGCP